MKKTLLKFLILIFSVFLIARVFDYLISPPSNFPVPYRITIDSGQTLFSISSELSKSSVIKFPRVFEVAMIVLGDEKKISEGEYYFEKPVSAIAVAIRVSGKQFGIDKKKITFPEGFTNKQIADRLSHNLDNFNNLLFLTLAKDYEGYLFPDTYHFFPSVTPDLVIATLRKNYSNKIAPLKKDIQECGRTEEQIIIMASIIEKEANGNNDREIISGILWKRFDNKIPLQVDAPFLYLIGKESKNLTKKDLDINSPYNTYRNIGLPPTPISNPGIEAISAAIHPDKSDYLFYLHDSDGNIYYAKTYEEHKKNISKYLNKK